MLELGAKAMAEEAMSAERATLKDFMVMELLSKLYRGGGKENTSNETTRNVDVGCFCVIDTERIVEPRLQRFVFSFLFGGDGQQNFSI